MHERNEARCVARPTNAHLRHRDTCPGKRPTLFFLARGRAGYCSSIRLFRVRTIRADMRGKRSRTNVNEKVRGEAKIPGVWPALICCSKAEAVERSYAVRRVASRVIARVATTLLQNLILARQGHAQEISLQSTCLAHSLNFMQNADCLLLAINVSGSNAYDRSKHRDMNRLCAISTTSTIHKETNLLISI